jgi:hypothetical protein
MNLPHRIERLEQTIGTTAPLLTDEEVLKIIAEHRGSSVFDLPAGEQDLLITLERARLSGVTFAELMREGARVKSDEPTK